MTKPPPAEREAFSRRLRAALHRAGKSREALADDLGLHYNTVGYWLRAERDCPVGWIGGIAASLDVPVQQLLEDPQPTNIEDAFARRVVDVLERPLTAPDLMSLLAEAKARLT